MATDPPGPGASRSQALDSQHFQHARLRAASILRWIALAFFAIGPAAAAIFWEYRTRGYATPPPFFMFIPPLIVLMGFWLPAAVMAFATQHMARWLVPTPPALLSCPACGYPVAASGPCPECGREVNVAVNPKHPQR